MDELYKELLEEAKAISKNAYAPYSDFQVGACALYENGKKYLGVNVENASYGLSICAERNAMANAAIHGEKSKITAIAIYSPKQKRCLPCGACRQWLCEFALNGDTKISLEAQDGNILVLTLNDIFPYGFKFEN